MEDDSSFARVKLRRRIIGGFESEVLEPVEYQESEEDETEHKNCTCLLDWILDRGEKMSGVGRSFLLLYSGYCISCVGDRLWTFAIVFILERLGGMRLVCINQFIDAISAMLLSGYLGNWLDRHDRRHGTLTVLAVNNISVAISAFMLFICLSESHLNTFIYSSCIALSIIFCALSKCASEGEKLSFTKDWIVVLAKKEGSDTLSKKNAMMTVIDQTSSVIAPLITSYSLTFLGYQGACAFFVCVNLVFWVIERGLLTRVYMEIKELHSRERINDSDPTLREELDLLTKQKHVSLHRRLGKMFHAYFRQSVFPAAFGLSMLYMTVLGFDGLAISFGKSQKLPDDVIGWFRSAGSVLGIMGATSYTFAERRFGVRRAGLVGLLLQQICLYLCILSIVLPGSSFDPRSYWQEMTWETWWGTFIGTFYSTDHAIESQNLTIQHLPNVASIEWSTLTIEKQPLTSIFVFFMGLTLARFGLWMADLSITQLMQEQIPEEERGTVFGVQNASCQLFSVAKDLIVIIFPDPRTFGWLIIMSVTFVAGGFLNYIYYLIKTRQRRSITHENRQSSRRLLKVEEIRNKEKASQEMKSLTT